jgi:hypothetical protein
VLPGEERLDALPAEQALLAQELDHLVPEEQLGRRLVDIGDAMPGPAAIPATPGRKGMDVRMDVEQAAKRLDRGHHPDAKVGALPGGGHQLASGLVRGASQAPEELTMVHEVGPQHLGDGEDPVRVPDLRKNLVAQEAGEGGRPLRRA